MEIQFAAIAKVKIDYKLGCKPTLQTVDIEIGLDEQVDESMYRLPDTNLTKEGCNVATQCFIQGAIANVKYAHALGYRDESEHLRYIVAELERAFVANADVNIP